MVLAVLMIAASFCIPTAAVQKVDVAALLAEADCYINFDDGIVDVNGNYEPANCRWVPMSVQNRNKRPRVRSAIT
jgi:hypothetical protein